MYYLLALFIGIVHLVLSGAVYRYCLIISWQYNRHNIQEYSTAED